jgi:hypothetical protein
MRQRIVKLLIVLLTTGTGCSVTTIKPDINTGSPVVMTDKTTYEYGEAVNVTFSGASGTDSDWICVVPTGSPDTEGGDYKFLPKGIVEGIRTFDSHAPGKYEVRAYYNYRKVGYVVAARTAFSVTGNGAYEKAMEERISRKLNPDDPLEAKVPSDKGVVYIVREPWRGASTVEVQILCNDKPVTMLANTDKYPFVVSSGECRFRTGSLFEIGSKATVAAGLTGETIVKVKPGHVYYLKVKVVPRVSKYDNFLENVPLKEGAEMMRKAFICPDCPEIQVAADKGKSSLAIAIDVDVHAQLTVMQSFVPKTVFYIKLDSKEDSLKKDRIIASGYRNCTFINGLFGKCKETFLLNTEPGIYAAVGAYGTAGTVEAMVFFPEEVITSTVVEVIPDSIAYMGRYDFYTTTFFTQLPNDSHDEYQKHYYLLAINNFGDLRKKIVPHPALYFALMKKEITQSPEAESAFLNKYASIFSENGYSIRFKNRIDELGR